jgi:DNA-binding transcriptional LysR family regulator
VELVYRRGRRVELSAVGLSFLPLARQLSELETDATSLLRDSGALRQGSLKIGAVGPFHVTAVCASGARAGWWRHFLTLCRRLACQP